MGCDIHGYVEVNQYEGHMSWSDVIDIGSLTSRNYYMFACLFGVRNYVEFEPVAADRGLPNKVGWGVREIDPKEHPDYHSLSYITAQEIRAIDWSAMTKDEFECFDLDPSSDTGGTFNMRCIAWKEAINKEWTVLFEMVDVLASHYGIENVRLVVWFDN